MRRTSLVVIRRAPIIPIPAKVSKHSLLAEPRVQAVVVRLTTFFKEPADEDLPDRRDPGIDGPGGRRDRRRAGRPEPPERLEVRAAPPPPRVPPPSRASGPAL